MVSWDKDKFKDDGKFMVTYRYNGVIKEATVEEVRLSYITLYRLRGENKTWDIAKKESGEWYGTSHYKMNEDLLKVIGEGIDIYLKKRGW